MFVLLLFLYNYVYILYYSTIYVEHAHILVSTIEDKIVIVIVQVQKCSVFSQRDMGISYSPFY